MKFFGQSKSLQPLRFRVPEKYPTSSAIEPLHETFTHYDPSSSSTPHTAFLGNVNTQKTSPKPHGFPHAARICLRILSLLLSITIIGIISHTIYLYHDNKEATIILPHGSVLRAWPLDSYMKLLPTWLMFGAAGVDMMFNIVALVMVLGLFKKTRERYAIMGPITAVTTLTLTWALWIAVLAYFKSWDTGVKGQYDLWSWTCTHREFELKDENELVGFTPVCREMSYTFYAGIIIAVLELINLVALIYTLIRSRGNRSKSAGLQSRKYEQLEVVAI